VLTELQRHLDEAVRRDGTAAVEIPEMAVSLLQLEKVQILSRLYAESAYRDEMIGEALKSGLEMARAAAKGERGVLARRKGTVEWAYIARNDGSAQPYVVHVPESYDGKRPFGLFVFLHGYAYDMNKYNWVQMMLPLDEIAEIGRKTDTICLMPYGRGNTDFQGVGEDDVLEVIRRALGTWKIDADRVVLGGISMGGMGVWTIAAHHPDRFAAVIPISARGDYYLWHDIDPAALPRWKQKQVGVEFGHGLLPNLQMSALILCGSNDTLVNPEQSRRMAAGLKREGCPVQLKEFAEADHYSWTELILNEPLLDLVRTARRKTQPKAVRYRTWTLKFNGAWWAHVEQMENWLEPSELTARVTGPGRVEVKTQNVSGVRLELSSPLCGAQEVEVVWNGVSRRFMLEGRPKTVRLGWEAGPGARPQKRPDFCGPIREGFAGPFAIVCGSEDADGKTGPGVRMAAAWYRYAQGMPRLVQDGRVTDRLIRDYNLILTGTPGTNRFLRRIADKLPIRFEARAGDGGEDPHYVVGDHAIPARDRGLAFIWPNPLNPKRYVVVMSGLTWGKDLAPNHIFDMLPDYIVFGGRKATDGTDSQEALCAGYFDSSWRLDPKLLWRREALVAGPE
jgi:pimeloyl-ACP methyl ester carboxylesterase